MRHRVDIGRDIDRMRATRSLFIEALCAAKAVKAKIATEVSAQQVREMEAHICRIQVELDGYIEEYRAASPLLAPAYRSPWCDTPLHSTP